jgi:hypothetical protein
MTTDTPATTNNTSLLYGTPLEPLISSGRVIVLRDHVEVERLYAWISEVAPGLSCPNRVTDISAAESYHRDTGMLMYCMLKSERRGSVVKMSLYSQRLTFMSDLPELGLPELLASLPGYNDG